MSSRRHPASATSTRRIPSEKLSARVRSATALPHATGQASSGLSAAGARCRALATMVSKPEEARFKAWLQRRQSDRKEMIVASENAASLYVAVEAEAAATLARFFASLRRCVAEYRLPRQRRAPHKQGASSSPS